MCESDHEKRDRALFQIMFNEGRPREEINELIATKDHVELDRLYNKLSADTERATFLISPTKA